MRTTLFLVLLLISTNLCQSQFEEYFDIDYLTLNYYDMTCNNEGTVFITGTPNTVMKSTNKGINWDRCSMKGFEYLYGIDCYQNHIIAVGNKGLIHYSFDSGNTWKKADSIIPSFLYDVVLIDNNNALAFGSGGTIFKSINGGIDWSVINTPFTFTIKTAVYYNNVVYFASETGKVYKSVDIGENWVEITLPKSAFIPLNFQTKNDSLYLFTNIGVFALGDNGTSWKYTELDLLNYQYGLISSKDNLYFVGKALNILIYNKNYKLIKDTNLTSKEYPIPYTSISKIMEFEEDELLAIGTNNLILKSKDGGTNWEMISYLNSFNNFGFGGLDFLSDSISFIGSKYESLFKTIDGGNTWKYFNDYKNGIVSNYLGSIHFFDTTQSIIISQGGFNYLIFTNDTNYIFERHNFNRLNGADPSILCLSDKKIIFKGSKVINNFIYSYNEFYDMSTNEWYNPTTFDSVFLRNTVMINNTIVACGSQTDSSLLPLKPVIYYHGVIMRTTDEGKNWSRIDVPKMTDIIRVDVWNGDTLKVISKLTNIDLNTNMFYTIFSSDAGKNWIVIDSSIDVNYYENYRLPNNYYLKKKNKGELLLSTDSMKTWMNYSVFSSFITRGLHVSGYDVYLYGKLSDTYFALIRFKLKNKYVEVKETKQVENIPLCWLSKPYPNPANNIVNFDIVWAIKYSQEELKVKVYDLYGFSIDNPKFEITGKTINSGILSWHPSGLTSGIYFVELNVGGYKRTEKVMIMK